MLRLLLLLAPLVLLHLTATPSTAQQPELKTAKDKVSYGVGERYARRFAQDGLDLKLVAQGILDHLAGKSSLTDEEFGQAIEVFEKEQQAEMAAQAEKNLKVGQEFLAKNKTAQGVVALPSGLQYKVLKSGTGATPKPEDVVRTHYKGTLIDGTEFDSSFGGEPIEFPVGGVIQGWTESLLRMKVGDKWMLYIPADLAYGEAGRPGIPPNSVLVFEIELLEVVKP